MKRIMCFVMAALMLTLCACQANGGGNTPLVSYAAKSAEAGTTETSAAASGTEPATAAPTDKAGFEEQSRRGEDSHVQQYGDTNADIVYDGSFNAAVFYPIGEITAIDSELKTRAKAAIENVRGQYEEAKKTAADAMGDLSVNYDSYMYAGRYVGVLESGDYSVSNMAHPAPLVFTINADLSTGEVMTPSQVFADGYVDGLKSAVAAKLNAIDATLGDFAKEIDESWFKYFVITDKGVTFVLPRGDQLPSAAGTVYLDFSVNELGSWYKLASAPASASTAPSSAAASGEKGFANTDGLHLRAQPEKAGALVATLARGTEVTVTDKNAAAGWYAVAVGGKTGYIKGEFIDLGALKKVPDNVKIAEEGTCTADDVNVRADASPSSEKLGTLAYGEKVEVMTKNTPMGWHKIYYNGRAAYVIMDYIKFPSGDNGAPAPAVTPDPKAAAGQTNGKKPMIALTFDDGPSDSTVRILDMLTKYGGKGTFCVVGSRVQGFSGVVKKVAEQGSEIACHTWSHTKLAGKSKDDVETELRKTNDIVKRITGRSIRFLRPPYGSVDDTVKAAALNQGMAVVNWSIDTEDWRTKNADATYRAIMANVKPGSIILCHDLYSTTADAMEKVIPKLAGKYNLVTVSELLKTHGGIRNGQVYRYAKVK